MRTLTVIAEMGTGGAESVVADLAGHLAASGEATCVASSGGWRADELAAAGVPTLAVPLCERGPIPLVRTAAALRRETRERPVDLVHAHNVRATLAAHLGTRVGGRRRPPLVTTVHGLAEHDYPRAVRVLRLGDLVVAVSDDVADSLLRAGLERSRLRVVENAVPPPYAGPDGRDAVRAELGVAATAPVVICSARLAPPKRLDLLLEAWPRVPDALLLVAGDGPDRAALERKAEPVRDRVRFLGVRRDVGRLLAAADVAVLASDREGLPMAVLEAMAAGVPVVASGVGELARLSPGTVELVAPGSAAELATAITRVLGDPARRRALSEQGRALVARRFSSSRMQSDYRSVYEGLKGGTGMS